MDGAIRPSDPLGCDALQKRPPEVGASWLHADAAVPEDDPISIVMAAAEMLGRYGFDVERGVRVRHFRTLGSDTSDSAQVAEEASRELQMLEAKYSADPGTAVLVWDTRLAEGLRMHLIAFRRMAWTPPAFGAQQPQSLAMSIGRPQSQSGKAPAPAPGPASAAS